MAKRASSSATDHFSALKIWMFENKFVSLPSHLKTIEPMEVHRESRTMCNTETSKVISRTDPVIRAIIGTNSVVAKDIPPYAIAVGNPCRVVRKRFDEELIDILLKLRWWDKSIEEIENLMPILSCSDLEKVKEELKTRLCWRIIETAV